MRRLILLAACGLGFSFTASADLMPDFANIPTGWFTDRYAPHAFANIGPYQGRDNVLAISINQAEGLPSRTGGYQNIFYNTQGRQHLISGGAGNELAASLYIPSSWSDDDNGNARTDMWAVMTDGTSITDYPIIGFTNYGGAARYRVWDENLNGGNGDWVNLAAPVAYDAWTRFGITFTGTSYQYTIDGNVVFTDTAVNGSTQFSATIMQAYNFFDPGLGDTNPVNYTAYWANAGVVPEPGTIVFLATVVAGIAARRKLRA